MLIFQRLANSSLVRTGLKFPGLSWMIAEGSERFIDTSFGSLVYFVQGQTRQLLDPHGHTETKAALSIKAKGKHRLRDSDFFSKGGLRQPSLPDEFLYT